MYKRSDLGFTIIEILVAITILGLISAFTIPSYKRFNDEQELKNATLNLLQSIRQTQSSSQSRTTCSNNVGSLDWEFRFNSPNRYQVITTCEGTPTTSQSAPNTFLPTNISIKRIQTSAESICPEIVNPTTLNLSLIFKNRGNVVSFSGSGATDCLKNSAVNWVKIYLGSSKITKQMILVSDKGGALYVQE